MTFRATLLALVLIATACGGSDEPESAASAPAIEAEPAGETSSSTAAVVESETTTSTSEAPAEAEDVEEVEEPPEVDEVEEAEAAPAPVTDARAARPASLEADCSAVGRVGVGQQTGTITSGGVEYSYQWTVPSSYTGEPIAVVIDFHGIGSNGAQQAAFSGWAAKAEAEGFLSVQPTGVNAPPDERPSWELPQFELPIRDDVVMVLDLIDHIEANVCIDPARIYSTGMSNGGFFTSEVVCDLSERIAAAVSVAGVTHHESCNPTRPVPYLAFHGIDDTTIPFNGGGESTLAGAESGSAFFEQVMPDEFAEFAATFGCAESVDSAVTAEVTLTSWSGCDDDVEMGFYAIAGAGHTWPGSVISSAIPSLGVTNMDISATDTAWDFFLRHSLATN